MDTKKYFFSALNDKEIYKNNRKDNANKTKFLSLQKLSTKNNSYISQKSYSGEIEIKNSNKDLSKISKSINGKVKQHKIHPFRQLNLKIINEDLKNKLFEMSLESSPEKDREFEKPKPSSEKYQSNVKNIINGDSNEQQNDNNPNKNGVIKKISIEIPEKIDKSKKKIKNKISRNRKLKRIRNLYDSNDDDESDDEENYYVINPETNIIAIFDFFIIIFYAYYYVVTTFNLCVETCFCPTNKNKSIIYNISFSDVILIINDLLCIADLILSFFRDYYDHNYNLIKSHKLIILFYLKFDFIFDFLCAIPVFSISRYICLKSDLYRQCFKFEMSMEYLLLKLCFLLKSFKIKKILGHKKNQALDRFIESISENYAIERTVIILINAIKYLGIFHLFVCFHIFIGNHTYPNWLMTTKIYDKSRFDIYVESLYFIVTTLTTVGYGDVICQSIVERIFQIIILAIGSVFYPYVVSLIGNFIENDSNAKIKQSKDLSMLEKIRSNYPNIPFTLYNKIYSFLDSKSYSLEKYDINSFIETLPFSFKNSILFTMYKNTINNFKFFKNNNNSVFISEVLNNFIPSISKKEEFLVYEGEMLQEIIFIKDGKISLNAAINTENPLKSINRYFTESFSPFTTAEERKLISNGSVNNKSHYSTVNEISYNRAKNKLNNALQNIHEEKNTNEKSQFLIRSQNNNNINDNFDFDINGGAIINEEGNNQYLKIVYIRKNEHFGCVFMTLNRPCPLSIEVNSKIVELFLLKKEQALNLSKSYPNIWRKIYAKEFHNLRTIKKKTFSVLKKYVGMNELLLRKNIDELKTSNLVSSFDINILDKRRSNNSNQSNSSDMLPKNNTINYEYDKNDKKLNLVKIKSKIKKKFGVKRNSTYDEKIIKNIPNNSNIIKSSPNKVNIKKSLFSSLSTKNNLSGNRNNSNNSLSSIKKKIGDKILNNEYKTRKEKLKNLKLFLIECKKYFTDNNLFTKSDYYQDNNNNGKNNNITVPLKKSCLKSKSPPELSKIKNILNINKEKKVVNLSSKNVVFSLNNNDKNLNMNNKLPLSEKLIKDLKDICNDDKDFSFCSTSAENNYNSKGLTIERNTKFEILSSYQNLNKLTKGKYIKDNYFQKKLKYIIKDYYKNKQSNFKNTSISNTVTISSSDFEDNSEYEDEKNDKKSKRINNHSSNNEKTPKEKYNSYFGAYKFNKMKTRKKKFKKYFNKTDKEIRNNLIKNKLSINDVEVKNNFDYFSTFKKKETNIISEKENDEINNSDSVKVNKSKTTTLSKNQKNIKYENTSNKDSLDINIKKNVNVYDNTEIEYIIDKEINKKNINDNIIINNISNKNNEDYQIYNTKKKKKNHKYNKSKYANIITNNILTTSSNVKESKNNFNSMEKIKNFENVSIYNIFQKNINKNLNIIDNNEKINQRNYNGFCNII